jgi:resuscitation-promoting factor RpfE
VPAPARTALFLLSLLLFAATATPVAWGHEDHDQGDRATREELLQIIRQEPGTLRARSIDAHLIEQIHERHGHELWANGRGHWGHSWATFKVQAHQLRRYLASQSEAVRRFALVVHWSRVAECESGGDWGISTGNGYYGGLQFSLGTWKAYGGAGMPQEQPAWFQAQIADNVRRNSGLHHWPVCGSRYR